MHSLIALVGFKGSGKNSAADYLIYENGYSSLAFADSLKDCLATTFRWDRAALEGSTDASRAWREKVDPWWAEKLAIPHFTPRWAMTNFGTDVMRKFFHDDIWLLNIERRLMELRDDEPVIITDVRFPNEVAFVRRLGGRIARIKRGPEPSWWDVALAANFAPTQDERLAAANFLETHHRVHSSEYALVGHAFDRVIPNNGTVDVLRAHILNFAGLS